MNVTHATRKEDTLDPVPDAVPDPVLDLVKVTLATADDKKAIDPVVLDVSEHLRIVDYFVIMSGSNRRQVKTLVDEIRLKLREAGHRPLRVEGAEEGEWVLVDYGDVAIHVFLEETRRFYDLEYLWSDAPRLSVVQA